MVWKLVKALTALGVVFIISFTLFSIVLTVFFNPQATTTSTTTSAAPTTTTTEATSSSTTTTTSPPATTSSTTTSSTTSSTLKPIECGSDLDCGEPYYSGTYYCNEMHVVCLLKYKPNCVGGECKEKTEIELLDTCGRGEICIPGRARCVNSTLYENVSEKIEIYSDRYVESSGRYQFKLNYTQYVSEVDISAVYVDVLRPDGSKGHLVARWNTRSYLDDLEVGLYSVKRNSAVIWIEK